MISLPCPPSPAVDVRDRPTAGAERLLVRLDAHVHLYPCHDPVRWLDAAAANLDVVAAQRIGVLMLAETARDDAFGALAAAGEIGPWTLTAGVEPGLLVARRQGRPGEAAAILWIVQGFQAVTLERLEVLALATTRRPVDGAPLASTVAAVRAAGGLAVLPWGLGKWLGRRAAVLAAFLDEAAPSEIFLGDNGGRPRGWPTPAPLRRWQAGPVPGRCLAGSDSLPLPDEADRVGSLGVEWRGELDPERPLSSLREVLRAPETVLAPWPGSGGGRVGPWRFLMAQLGLRLTRLRGAGTGGLEHDTRTPDIHTASAGYARRFAGPVGAYLLEVQEQALAAVLPEPREAAPARRPRALDVGGGHGQLTAFLLGRGYDVWVQGSAAAWSERLTELRMRHPDRVHLVVADLWRLPFADRSFDLVAGFRLLAHVEETRALVLEMSRVSGDALVVDYAPLWSANLLEPVLFRLKRLLEGNTRPFFCYTRAQLAGWLSTAGLSQIRQAKEFWLPMVIHRKLRSPERSARLEDLGRRLGLTAWLGAPVVLLARRPCG